MKQVLFYLSLAMAVGALAEAGAAYAAKPGKENEAGKNTYPADFKPPIPYGKDLVGVTPEGTLSVRYRGDWNDIWGKALQSYLAEAKENAAARGTQTKKVVFAAPIQKNTQITAGEGVLGNDGKPLRGHWSMPESQQESLREQAKMMADFFYAASDGEVTVDFIFPVLDGLKVSNAPGKAIFSIWPRGLQDQLLPMLKEYENAGVIMWIFISGRPVIENGEVDAKGKPTKRFGNGPFGISYTAWPLYGGYCQACTAASAGLWVHEFNHRWLDGLKSHEGVALTRNHSLGQLGFAPGHSLDEGYFATYRYIIRPAMWKRFSITTPNHTPLEPFSGKAYEWRAVQDDCWFKLPELHNAELARLTGIDSFEIDIQYGGHARLFRVAQADRAKVLSRYIEPPVPVKVKKGQAPPPDAPPPPPVQLDNYIETGKESCAVVKTATGQWLFVSANMADLYADMLKISGKGSKPLEVYGYVNEGILPLLVFKAPADLALPICEEGYFRTPAVGGAPAAN
ncbi:MAG: hypothetical protein ISS78_00045 [Phycisphaerae bacterium]|nr:hypothetical protein [Phycisphaerae bacterium]